MVKLIVSQDDMFIIGPIVFLIFWIGSSIPSLTVPLAIILSIAYTPIAIFMVSFTFLKINGESLWNIVDALRGDGVVKVSTDVDNAYSTSNTILPIVFINDELYESEETRNAVVNHEIAHAKYNHLLKNSIVTGMFVLITVVVVMSISNGIISLLGAGISILIAGLFIGNMKYYQEIEADLYASKQDNSNIRKFRENFDIEREKSNFSIGFVDLKYKDIHPDSETFIKKIDENQ